MAAVDTDSDGLLSDNELRTLAAILTGDAPSESLSEALSECIANHSAAFSSNLHPNHSEVVTHSTPLGTLQKSFSMRLFPTIEEALGCPKIEEGLREKVDWRAKGIAIAPVMGSDKDVVAFEMIGDNYTDTLRQLDSVRARQSKFICINDNMQNPSRELETALQDFFSAFFPIPSIFELPVGKGNPTLYLDEYLRLYPQSRQYPSAPSRPFRLSFAFSGRAVADAVASLKSAGRALMVRLVHFLVVVLEMEELEEREHYVKGLRRDIRKVPRGGSRDREGVVSGTAHFSLLLSVVALLGLVALRRLIRRKHFRVEVGRRETGMATATASSRFTSFGEARGAEGAALIHRRGARPLIDDDDFEDYDTNNEDTADDGSGSDENIVSESSGSGHPEGVGGASEEESDRSGGRGGGDGGGGEDYFSQLMTSVGLGRSSPGPSTGAGSGVPRRVRSEGGGGSSEDEAVRRPRDNPPLAALPAANAAPSKSGLKQSLKR